MTRISNHHLLGASRRLPPRLTLLASSHKYKVKEERKRILKLSVKKLRAIEDPEAFLTRSVLINNTLKRLQTEVREEKASKKTSPIDYNPSPYSFYSIEKAYREEMERLDSNGNSTESTSSLSQGRLDNAAAAAATTNENNAVEFNDNEAEMFEADDEADDSDSSASSSSSSSSEEESDNEETNQSGGSSAENGLALNQPKNTSLEDDLLSEVYMPTPPPPQMIGSIDDVDIELKPTRPSTPVPWSKPNPSAEAVMKSSCDNNEADFLSEAVRTECWTKPVDTPVSQSLSQLTNSVTSKSTLTSNSVNTQSWPHLPDLSWPSYTPSANATTSVTNGGSSMASEAAPFQPNITVPSCSSHKENLYNSNSSQLSEKCYSCGQSSLFQSELQSVVFNSLIASLET